MKLKIKPNRENQEQTTYGFIISLIIVLLFIFGLFYIQVAIVFAGLVIAIAIEERKKL